MIRKNWLRMSISIVICTYNRASYLKSCLLSLVNQSLSQAALEVEIVIVDNNSSDATKNVVEELQNQSRFPLRYIFEPQQGLSFARNAGIQASQFEIIAFLDDDAVALPDWLESILLTFSSTPSSVVCGPIDLNWESSKPSWLPESMFYFLGFLSFGNTIRELTQPGESPFGGNVAIKKDIFSQVGFFNPKLGRVGARLLDSEEIDLFSRVRKSGAKIWYCPSMKIRHAVAAARTRKDFFKTSAFWKGRSAFRVSLLRDGTSLTLFRLLKRMTKGFIDLPSSWLFSWVGNPQKAIYYQCEYLIDKGFVLEALDYTKDRILSFSKFN